MANYCENFISISRIDWEFLTQEQRELFLRKTYEPQMANVTNFEMPDMRFDFNYAVPVNPEVKDQVNERYEKRWTKWIDDVYIQCNNDYCLEAEFYTAWAPPSKWLQEIIHSHPELCIDLSYDEPSMCFQWEMWRSMKWEIYDVYREWEEYLHTCESCEYHKKDSKYREDADSFLCDICYDLYLKDHKTWDE